MDAIYGIPIIGLVVQFVVYVFAALPVVAPTIVAAATPIALGAMCGFMNERSGVVNIGIEGMMLTAAFVAWWTASLAAQLVPNVGIGFLGITLPLLIGLVAAILAAMAVSAVHAWLSISVRADQIISGTIINIFAVGITGYLNLLISKQSPPSAGQFQPLQLGVVEDIPVLGFILDSLIGVGPIGLTMLISVIVLQVLLFRSRWGLRTRAVGEHPKAAETVGIDVIRLRYRNVILGGVFAGLAGAYLTIEFGSAFQGEMTAGRGFIALAALIFGRWTPVGAFGAALLFTASIGLERSIRFAPPEGQLGEWLTAVPLQFYGALPYLITIIVLAGVVGRSLAPAAVGRPYERESKAA
ncbi:MAG TPA: ABC transporter permease [Candidatus Dormibacteraeota bacterium]|nr:ABC transporter permease [Candidatus Dormibacteraeota bacterium]